MSESDISPPPLPMRSSKAKALKIPIVDDDSSDYGELEDMPLPPLPEHAPSLSGRHKGGETLYLQKHETLSGGAVFAEKTATLEEISKTFRGNRAYMNMLVKCQAISRGFIIRNRLKSTPKEDLRKKIKLFASFFKKEVEFQAKLKTFDVTYIQVIAKSKFKNFDYSEFKVVKDYIDFIYSLQKKIMSIFIHLQEKGHPFYYGIYSIVDVLKEDFQKYGSYLDNARTFYATFLKWKRKSTEFEEFLNIKQLSEEGSSSLELYLLLPVKHIIGYLKYVNSIRKITPRNIPEYAKLEQSVASLKLIQEYIIRGDRQDYNPHYCYVLNENLGNIFSTKYPESSSRTHICNFDSVTNHKGKDSVKHIAILSDKVLVMKTKPNKKTGALFEIEDSYQTDLISNLVKKENGYKLEFKDKKSFTFHLSEEDEKRIPDIIKKVASDNNSEKILFFGGNLTSIYNRYGGKDDVPSFISNICCFLMKFTEFKGLFHLSSTAEAQPLINAVKENPNYMLLASRDDCYHVVVLLHKFLKNLGETIFPQSFYQRFIKLDLVPDDDDFVEELHQILDEIPKINFKTLSYIISFFVSFLSKSKANVFKLNALGIIVGPTLIAPPPELENNPEIVKNVTKINSICARMMDQAYRLQLVIGMPF